MKTIGLIGGTGWVSTLEYYRLINQEVNNKLGGHNAARCVLYSVNYADVNEYNLHNDHEGVYKIILNAANSLKSANVDFLVLCANTMHQYVDRLTEELKLPFVHIADATANEIKKKGLSKVALLGTKFTMEMDFYTRRLSESGIQSFVPDKEERLYIHRVIMDELVKNIFKPESKKKFLEIISEIELKGAQGIVLGCTEIPLLIKQEDLKLPVFDTLKIHANAIVDYALAK
jgi:aspartate racemase